MKSQFATSFEAKLDALGGQIPLSKEPSAVRSLAEDDRRRVLAFLLESACQAQGSEAIELGRKYLLKLPRKWVVERIGALVDAQLELRDEYEFRLLLDLYEQLDDALLDDLVQSGLASENPEIKAVAAEVIERTGQRQPVERIVARWSARRLPVTQMEVAA